MMTTMSNRSSGGFSRAGVQKGFSVVDMAIGMAILAGLMVWIFQTGGNLTGRTEISTASSQHSALRDGVLQMYSDDATFAGLDNVVALNSHLAVPKKMRGTGEDGIKHIWSRDGKGIDLSVTDGGQTFTITYDNIPGNVCNEFVNSIRPSALYTQMAGTAIESPVDVSENCDDEADTNSVAFTYN